MTERAALLKQDLAPGWIGQGRRLIRSFTQRAKGKKQETVAGKRADEGSHKDDSGLREKVPDGKSVAMTDLKQPAISSTAPAD